jgi:hypothetical protein
MSHKATLNMSGDILTVEWTGSVWESPCNGQQHARRNDAMRAELERYLRDCGEDTDAMEEEIEGYLSEISEHNHPVGCSCGSPDCPEWQATMRGD